MEVRNFLLHWHQPIYTKNKQTYPISRNHAKIRDNHNLKWLRVAISYHKIPSLGQAFKGIISTKLTKDVISEEYFNLSCNCSRLSKVNGEYFFGGTYRKLIVAYKAEYRDYNS